MTTLFLMMMLVFTSYVSGSDISPFDDSTALSEKEGDLVEVVLKVPRNALFVDGEDLFVNYDGFVLPVKSLKKTRNDRIKYRGVCEYGHLIICGVCGGCGHRPCEYSCACDPRAR